MHAFFRSARAICAIAVAPVFVISLYGAAEGTGGDARKSARLNCGAKIECTMPESARRNGQSTVVIMGDDSIRCPLSEGDTTFVVALPNSGAPEQLKFVNENAAARGTLKIAVSNEALAPNSSRWTPVDGNVSFRHKRLFNLSVVGVEAKFVRVTFSVDREARDFTLALKDFQPAKRDLFNANLGEISAKHVSLGDSLAIADAVMPIVALNP
jgi:hypothetical protein